MVRALSLLRTVGAVTPLWTTVAGRTMHARVCRRPGAPAVIFVHGLGVSSRYMSPSVLAVGAFADAFAPDLPGFGRSEKPAGYPDIPQMADNLVAWMDAIGVGRALLVGNSVGCQVVTSLAVRHPARVRGLVLTGPTMDPSRRPAGQVLRWLCQGTAEPFTLPPLVIWDYLSAGLRRTWQTFRLALQDPVAARLPQVTAPTLVVRGGRDWIVSLAWAQQVARALPAGRLVTLKRAGHAVNYDAPRALARLIRVFLRGCP